MAVPRSRAGADPQAAGAAAEPPLVRLRDVGFTYPSGTTALDGLTLSLGEGEVLGVVGPSGCGKSSLLALLARLREPTAGSLAWSPDPVERASGRARHPTSMVFQKDTVLPWLTVEANVRFFYKLNPARRDEAAEVVPQLIEMAGLEAFRDAYPHQLSGGMRRRVAFIVAMAARPRLLLLDEPFSSLDEPTRVAIHQDVLTVVRRLGTSVVVVTHDLAEAASLCDRILILTHRPGRVAAEYAVPFAEPRDVLRLREQPDFLALSGRLWHDLSRQIERGARGAAEAAR